MVYYIYSDLLEIQGKLKHRKTNPNLTRLPDKNPY